MIMIIIMMMMIFLVGVNKCDIDNNVLAHCRVERFVWSLFMYLFICVYDLILLILLIVNW